MNMASRIYARDLSPRIVFGQRKQMVAGKILIACGPESRTLVFVRSFT